MATLLNQLCFGRDIQGLNAYARQFSGLTVGAFFVGSGSPTASNFVVPNTAQNFLAFFSYTAGVNFWVCVTPAGQTPVNAAIPVGTSIAAVNSCLNPSGLLVNKGDNISVITDAASGNCPFGIEFFINQLYI